MPSPLEVVTDNSGRINFFVNPDYENERLAPMQVGEAIIGGERVVHRGREFDITPSGSLVDPDTELFDTVILGSGVIIGKGTKFLEMLPDSDDPLDTIVVGDGARIEGTHIADPVTIGNRALVLAKVIGAKSVIGDYARIGGGTIIQSNVLLGETVKLDRECVVAANVCIDDAVRAGFKTNIGPGAFIGHHSKLGTFTGAGTRGVNQGGVFVTAGRTLPPYSRM